MKAFNLCLALVISLNIFGQWQLNGNNVLPTQFLGTLNNSPLIFTTNGTFPAAERMRLTPTGNLGINTTNPISLLHVSNGTVVFNGTTGANPNLGNGTQLQWIPSLSAFRAGVEENNEWDDPVVGVSSSVFGIGSTHSGFNGFTAGQRDSIAGNHAFCLGNRNDFHSADSMAVILGFDNEIQASFSFSFGYDNSHTGDGNFSFGRDVSCADTTNFGFGCDIDLQSETTFAFGCEINNTADGAMTFGYGLPIPGFQLTNNIDSSIMFGSFSNLPTMYITRADLPGINSFGSVGIALDPNLTNPTERLDVGGNARLRNVDSGAADGIVTAVHENGATDISFSSLTYSGNANDYLDGTGNWSTVGDDCDWDTDGTHVWTGLVDGCLPTGGVGIGLNSSLNAKLHVVNDANSSFTPHGIHVRQTSSTGASDGMSIRVSGASTPTGVGTGNTGVRINVTDSQEAYGIRSEVQTEHGLQAVGVFGAAGNAQLLSVGVAGIGGSTIPGSRSVGVYGEAAALPGNWAGYFVGNMLYTGPALFTSDETLKTNIEPLPNLTDAFMDLQPRSYDFRCDEFPHMNLSPGHHCGLIAQELQEVFPNLVSEATHPAQFDEEGNVIEEAMDYLAVNYLELLPVLIKVTQEQQHTINALNEQLKELEDVVDGCCQETDNRQQDNFTSYNNSAVRLNTMPNPFDTQCTLNIQLAQPDYVELTVYTSNGLLIDTIHKGPRMEGEHVFLWDASLQPSGSYLVVLQTSSERIVNTVIKR